MDQLTDQATAGTITLARGEVPDDGTVLLSVNVHGGPSGLWTRVLGHLGLSGLAPDPANLAKLGYDIVQADGRTIGFVVTTGTGDTAAALLANLSQCAGDRLSSAVAMGFY